jgi:hypothetical protein
VNSFQINLTKFSLFILLLSIFTSPIILSSQSRKEYSITARRISSSVKIDGVLSESDWAKTQIIDRLLQREPQEGKPVTEKTEIRVLYNSSYIYFGIKCFDSEPDKIVANEMRRDSDLQDNDYFEIFIDTYHDHRNAFYFVINPLGARRDAQIRDEGSNINWNWDGIWRTRVKRNPEGWTAEIAIPFYTLRFKESEIHSWGINFGRHIARKREECYWSPVSRKYGWFGKYRVSHCGHLTGLENLKQGNKIQFMPYIIGGAEQLAQDEPLSSSLDAGLDVKYRLSSNLTADITYNTDFAQVEADQEQFNLTRFSLFFPEKRGFFLEGADIFRIGESYREHEPPSTLLFFSRTIGLSEDAREIPIMGGLRITGKTGPYNIGILNILTDRIFDSNDSSQIDTGRTNHAVVRLKRDFLKKSSLGLMYLSKNNLDGYYYNRTAAFDFNMAFGQSLKIIGFIAKSDTPGLKGKDLAGNLDMSFSNDLLSFQLAYIDIGENFKSEMGFIPRTDIRKLKGNFSIGPRPGILNIRKILFMNRITYIENHAGRLESRDNLFGTFTLFQNGSQLFLGVMQSYEDLPSDFSLKEGVHILKDIYKFNLFISFYQSDKSKDIAIRAECNAGEFYNGNLFRLKANGYLKLSSHFSMEIIFDRNQFDLPVEGGKFTTNIAAGRLIYSFSPNLYAKAYLQWNSSENLFKSNFLIRWIYKPGANIFFIYNETRETGIDPLLCDRVIMLKVSFLFNF